MNEKILIIDFGSQFTQLIGRRIRELNVYCEIHPFDKAPLPDDTLRGVVLSGSPFSVNAPGSPRIDLSRYIGRVPVMGICYGAQYIASEFGGQVAASSTREYGRARLHITDPASPLMAGVPESSQVWMSHGDSIVKLPEGALCIASTGDVANAAYTIPGMGLHCVQFHPEVYHSEHGTLILSNFVKGICRCSGDWTEASYIDTTVAALRDQIGDGKVILGLSGGVDSTVAAVLLNRAIGENLYCIFVDNGLLRKNEFASVLDSYRGMGLRVKGVDAGHLFLDALRGVTDPEEKRKAIGKTFIDVFEAEARLVEGASWLGQGTIYPDVIESSAALGGHAAKIKSHHNVGGLPEKMHLKVVEPLRMLFKDEVRRIGKALGIDPALLGRHPFPGPSLGIRVLGEVTPDKLAILREADDIFISALRRDALYDSVWQAGVMLLPVKSVGVMGDERTYEYTVALRAVASADGMTADWVHLPYDFLARVSNDIINSVRGVNRVVYDISSKPPATIEWE